MLSGPVINVVSHHNVVWVEWLFWVALFQSMTQEHRGFVQVACFPKLFISCPVHGKERAGKAHPLLATPEQNHASSFSFISLKQSFRASVWYDRKLGPGVFSFPNCFSAKKHSWVQKPILVVVLLTSAALLQPSPCFLYGYSMCRSFRGPPGWTGLPTCGYTTVPLLRWEFRIARLRASNYDCSASVSLSLGFLWCSLSCMLSPFTGHCQLMYC